MPAFAIPQVGYGGGDWEGLCDALRGQISGPRARSSGAVSPDSMPRGDRSNQSGERSYSLEAGVQIFLSGDALARP